MALLLASPAVETTGWAVGAWAIHIHRLWLYASSATACSMLCKQLPGATSSMAPVTLGAAVLLCRQVSLEEGDAKARELSVNFIETSAKAGFNIKVGTHAAHANFYRVVAGGMRAMGDCSAQLYGRLKLSSAFSWRMVHVVVSLGTQPSRVLTAWAAAACCWWWFCCRRCSAR
jgi:hypothetical protein